MNRFLPDAALPPEEIVLDFFDEHLALICGIVALVAAVTVVLIVLLKKKRGAKK